MTGSPESDLMPPELARAPKRRRFLFRVALVVTTTLVALGLGEATLRVLGQGSPRPWPLVCKRPELFEANEFLGYRLHPSLRTTYRYPQDGDRTLKVNSNRDGFRGTREFDGSDSRTRIAFLGDSFVFGDGVEEAERFTDLVEASAPDWRVDNFGMTGYGPDLMLRALEQVGLPTHPAAVVLCMYTDDFRRVEPDYAGAGFPLPRFHIENGALVTTPPSAPGLWDGLRIVNAARRLAWKAGRMEWKVNQAILDRFCSLGGRDGFAPGIVFLPGRADSNADRERREWLAAYADRGRVPIIDLSDVVHEAGDAVFIPDNPHLNPAGHALVAQRLRPFVAQRVLRTH